MKNTTRNLSSNRTVNNSYRNSSNISIFEKLAKRPFLLFCMGLLLFFFIIITSSFINNSIENNLRSTMSINNSSVKTFIVLFSIPMTITLCISLFKYKKRLSLFHIVLILQILIIWGYSSLDLNSYFSSPNQNKTIESIDPLEKDNFPPEYNYEDVDKIQSSPNIQYKPSSQVLESDISNKQTISDLYLDSYLYLAKRKISNGEYYDAINYLNKSINANQNVSESYFELSKIFYTIGDTNLASLHFDKSIQSKSIYYIYNNIEKSLFSWSNFLSDNQEGIQRNCINQSDGSPISFNLSNDKCKTISGTFFVLSDYKDDASASLEICDNEEIVFSKKLSNEDKPFIFVVDISDIETLTINYYGQTNRCAISNFVLS